MKKLGGSFLVLGTCAVFNFGCVQSTPTTTTQGLNGTTTPTPTPTGIATPTPSPSGSPDPIKVSFFLTNDIHGHLENMGMMGGIVQQLRNQDEYASGKSALLVIDSGDQFQGTLISNYDEGESVFKVFNEIGYDAVIPGNHDYDFGPKNWQYDRVTPGVTSNNPREVIEDLSGMAKFPMLSANTYVKSSLHASDSAQIVRGADGQITAVNGPSTGLPVAVDDSCVPTSQTLSSPIDFVNAKRPDFLKPYTIITRAGVRIALIGIDHHLTTSLTTGEDVSDLCFRDEADTYLEIRQSLIGQADVFVMLMHNGNIPPSSFGGSDIVKKINDVMPGAVDLVAAGHTHQLHDNLVGPVHVVQDSCNATTYGRVDLYVDATTKKVIPEQTASAVGLSVNPNKCSTNPRAAFACNPLTMPVASQGSVDALVLTAANNVNTIGKKPVVTVDAAMPQASRHGESAEGDVMTDALRSAGGTQIAFMNAGGLRTSIKKGVLLYEDLFQVTPFGNLGVVMNAVPWKNLKNILLRTIATFDAYGTLEESGLRIQYSATNADPVAQLYKNSELVHVELLDGTVLYDRDSGFSVPDTATFSVTTLDYLAGGGDSFDFSGIPVNKTMMIARDLIAQAWQANPDLHLSGKMDGRFVNVGAVAPLPTATPTPPSTQP